MCTTEPVDCVPWELRLNQVAKNIKTRFGVGSQDTWSSGGGLLGGGHFLEGTQGGFWEAGPAFFLGAGDRAVLSACESLKRSPSGDARVLAHA